MTPRTTILRELSRSRQNGNGSGFTRPSDIAGFDRHPEKYQKAVNQLLSDRLVEGQKDEEGRMAIAINPHRADDVRKELRPVWARPITWVVLILLAVAAGVGFTV